MKKAVARYEEIAGVKINFEKNEGLRLGAWWGSILLPGPFRWSDELIRILGVWFGLGLQLERNWLEEQEKLEAQVLTSKTFVLKWQSGGVRRVHLPLDLLPLVCTSSAWRASAGAETFPLQNALGRSTVDGWLTGLLSKSVQRGFECAWPRKPLVRWKTGLLGPILVVGHGVRNVFSRLKSDPKAESRRKLKGKATFVCECHKALRDLPGSHDPYRPRKGPYGELVVCSASAGRWRRFARIEIKR